MTRKLCRREPPEASKESSRDGAVAVCGQHLPRTDPGRARTLVSVVEQQPKPHCLVGVVGCGALQHWSWDHIAIFFMNDARFRYEKIRAVPRRSTFEQRTVVGEFSELSIGH